HDNGHPRAGHHRSGGAGHERSRLCAGVLCAAGGESIMTTVEQTITWRVAFHPPLPLMRVREHAHVLKARGVYFILEGACDGPHNPFAAQVLYIGKAIRETIGSRGCKHLDTMTDARFSNGNPKTGNSKAFKRYRGKQEFDLRKLWFVPGVMDARTPYLISRAEGYFIHEFERRHGRKPECNTAS